jgi:hypothetical protein
MAKRKTKPLRCEICGRFIGYSEKIHYYQPNGGPFDVKPPEEELEHWRCFKRQKRVLKVAVGMKEQLFR